MASPRYLVQVSGCEDNYVPDVFCTDCKRRPRLIHKQKFTFLMRIALLLSGENPPDCRKRDDPHLVRCISIQMQGLF